MVNKKTKNTENLIYNIIMFALIFALVISFVFTIDKLILERPKDVCYLENYAKKPYNYAPEPTTEQTCDYDEEYISACYKSEGQIRYKKDCEIECNYCYRDYNIVLNDYNNKINIGRMIFTFILALAFAFIVVKDKIIKYAVLSSALVSLFVATISAMSLLNKMLPIVIILELLLVLFIYKKTNK